MKIKKKKECLKSWKYTLLYCFRYLFLLVCFSVTTRIVNGGTTVVDGANISLSNVTLTLDGAEQDLGLTA